MKLQLMIAKLNSSLEEQCEQVSAGLLRPKVLRDIESLQQEAVLLKGRISDVRSEMEKSNSQNAQESMQTLIEMDKLKQRMQATSKALKEADNWTTLTTEIEDVFDGSISSSDGNLSRSNEIDLALATTKLTGIQASLKILTHVPDYEDRVQHVEGLKNRLEALASPKLVAAFNGVDEESAKFFVKMFADMDRLPQLLKYYRKCIRARLLKAWAELVNKHNVISGDLVYQGENQDVRSEPDNISSSNFQRCSHEFFLIIDACITEQLPWFDAVFVNNCKLIQSSDHISSSQDNLLEILIEVYSSLEPNFGMCISATNSQLYANKQITNDAQPEDTYLKDKAFLNLLAELKREFNIHVRKVDELINPCVAADLTSDGRLNARLRDFARLIYQCFKPYIMKYPDLEKSVLSTEIKTSTPQTSKDIVDELRNVSGSVAKLIEILRAAAKRCFSITEGCSYPSLVQSVFPEIVELYSERYRTLMKRLDKRKSASHSWIILGQSLTLNQASGDLLLRLEDLDVTLTQEFVSHTRSFLDSAENSGKDVSASEKGINQHDLFLIENQGPITGEKLRNFYNNMKQGQHIESPLKSSTTNNIDHTREVVKKLCEDLQATTFSILFHPLATELSVIYDQSLSPNMVETIWADPWAGSDSRQLDMPDFSFAPQEYITKIGQYLMTLPQHLEPYMTHDNHGLSRALQERVFPYCTGVATITSKVGDATDFQQNTPADYLLSCISRATCQFYLEAILKIPEVSANATKQLYTDIGKYHTKVVLKHSNPTEIELIMLLSN